jgi:lipopolysaccharide/colanic/teichoic acid biosynthesis glycosyltransferase
MVVDAEKIGASSTSDNDPRITRTGRVLRKYKLDELPQLINVLKGDMSLVGPRPNVEREVALYTEEERKLLNARPGITGLASIVFSDEGDILAGSKDPDLKYNQVIRPWKSRLGLLCVSRRSLFLDIQIIGITAVAILSRAMALRGVQKLLDSLEADEQLRSVARREHPSVPAPSPGKIVTS